MGLALALLVLVAPKGVQQLARAAARARPPAHHANQHTLRLAQLRRRMKCVLSGCGSDLVILLVHVDYITFQVLELELV